MRNWLESAEEVYEGAFTVTGYEEGRPKQSQGNGNVRLVCCTKERKTLVFWGVAGEDTLNIDRVYGSKLPVKVRCQYIEPQDWGKGYGHDWWCPQNAKIAFES